MHTFFKDSRIYPMLGAMLAMFLAALDQTIVATALPEIVRELDGLQHLSWVVVAYMLTSTITVPLVGKLSDIYGRRRFFIGGIIVFLVGSVLSGMAWSMTTLIIFRAIQGIGGGAIMVNAFAVVGDLFAPVERGRWQGFIGAMFGLSSVAGPLLGGWLTDASSWRWIFYINVPLGILALAVVAATLPHCARREERPPIDWIGAFALAGAITPLLLALVWGGSEYAWGSDQIAVLFGLSAAFLLAFIHIEKRAKDPVLPLWLFSHRAFSVSVIVMFLVMIGMFGSILFIPMYAQGVIGLSASAAGFILTPMTLAVVASSAVVGQVVSCTGKYKVVTVVGVAVGVAAMYSFSLLTADTTYASLIARMVFMGLGLGAAMPVFNLVVQSAFDRQYLGVVTSALQVARSIGGTFGAALLGGIFNASLARQLGHTNVNAIAAHLSHDEVVAFASALSNMYFIATLILGLAFTIVLFLPELPLRRTTRPVAEDVGVKLEEEFGVSDPHHEPQR